MIFITFHLSRPLFQGENDFQICVRESLPQLKVKKMRAAEWAKIRRLMGKPRRYDFYLPVNSYSPENDLFILQWATFENIVTKEIPSDIQIRWNNIIIKCKISMNLLNPMLLVLKNCLTDMIVISTYNIWF